MAKKKKFRSGTTRRVRRPMTFVRDALPYLVGGLLFLALLVLWLGDIDEDGWTASLNCWHGWRQRCTVQDHIDSAGALIFMLGGGVWSLVMGLWRTVESLGGKAADTPAPTGKTISSEVDDVSGDSGAGHRDLR
ncbi:hypothetical protein Q9Q94_15295 [Uliginosibacterium sp. 31-16]|uniref:hypothetical protein n=1 Tax=Uliginosibacterium sp. 31-16 TaxID=3068315 RepID=UPI00273F4726|nr:hypothetical protein [Uliginosibacterium sp. 31-16]MDP5240906.1 hypothetical protein [Uliginosibacterium sp. 31-16]